MDRFEYGYALHWAIENFNFFPLDPTSSLESAELDSLHPYMLFNAVLRYDSNSLICSLKRENFKNTPFEIEYKLTLQTECEILFNSGKKVAAFAGNDSETTLQQFDVQEHENLFSSRTILLVCYLNYGRLLQKPFISRFYCHCRILTHKRDFDWFIPNFNALSEEEFIHTHNERVRIMKIQTVTLNSELDENEYLLKILLPADLPFMQGTLYASLKNCYDDIVGDLVQDSIKCENNTDKSTEITFELKGQNQTPIASNLPDNTVKLYFGFEYWSGKVLEYQTGEKEYGKCNRFYRDGEFQILELVPFTDLMIWKPDLELFIGGECFQVHTDYLNKVSPLFKKWRKLSKILKIPEEYTDAAEKSYSILYYKETPDVSSFESVSSLFIQFKRLEIVPLVEMCTRVIAATLSVENICEVFLLSVDNDDSDLREAAQAFFNANAKEILSLSMWKIFLDKYPKLAYEIVHTAFVSNF